MLSPDREARRERVRIWTARHGDQDHWHRTLVAEIESAAHAYYTDGTSTLCDAEYDLRLQALEDLEALHPYLCTPQSPTQKVMGPAGPGWSDDPAATTRMASSRQVALIQALLAERIVPAEIQSQATAPNLSHEDCTRLIPALQALPRRHKRDPHEGDDYISPEGYDDSPDMGVHRFDGGGFW